jgi:hypothetical protein
MAEYSISRTQINRIIRQQKEIHNANFHKITSEGVTEVLTNSI